MKIKISFVVVLLALALVFTSCDEKIHQHSFKTEWSSDANNHWHDASCEHTNEKSDFGPHIWQENTEKYKAPTCLEKGEKVFVCSVCNAEKIEEIAALGHDEQNWIIDSEPTCTTKGHRHQDCSRCDESVEEELDALGHQWSEWITDIEPTWTEDGHKYQQCSRCNTKEEANIAHTYVEGRIKGGDDSLLSTLWLGTYRQKNQLGIEVEAQILLAFSEEGLLSLTPFEGSEYYNIYPTIEEIIAFYVEHNIPISLFIGSELSMTNIVEFIKPTASSSKYVITTGAYNIGYEVELTKIDDTHLSFSSIVTYSDVNNPNDINECNYIFFSTQYGMENTQNIPLILPTLNEIEFEKLDFSNFTFGAWSQVENAEQLNRLDVQEIQIPSDVTTLRENAFVNYPFVTTLTIPDTVTTIEENAIGSNIFTTINLGASVQSIGEGLFIDCQNLVSINVSERNNYFKSVDGVLYTKEGKIVAYPYGKKETSYTIEEGTTIIGTKTFNNNHEISELTVPTSLRIIEKDALRDSYIDDIYYSGTMFDWLKINKGDCWAEDTSFTVHFSDESTIDYSDGEIDQVIDYSDSVIKWLEQKATINFSDTDNYYVSCDNANVYYNFDGSILKIEFNGNLDDWSTETSNTTFGSDAWFTVACSDGELTYYAGSTSLPTVEEVPYIEGLVSGVDESMFSTMYGATSELGSIVYLIFDEEGHLSVSEGFKEGSKTEIYIYPLLDGIENEIGNTFEIQYDNSPEPITITGFSKPTSSSKKYVITTNNYCIDLEMDVKKIDDTYLIVNSSATLINSDETTISIDYMNLDPYYYYDLEDVVFKKITIEGFVFGEDFDESLHEEYDFRRHDV